MPAAERATGELDALELDKVSSGSTNPLMKSSGDTQSGLAANLKAS